MSVCPGIVLVLRPIDFGENWIAIDPAYHSKKSVQYDRSLYEKM